jgi:hypothetical protein
MSKTKFLLRALLTIFVNLEIFIWNTKKIWNTNWSIFVQKISRKRYRLSRLQIFLLMSKESIQWKQNPMKLSTVHR